MAESKNTSICTETVALCLPEDCGGTRLCGVDNAINELRYSAYKNCRNWLVIEGKKRWTMILWI